MTIVCVVRSRYGLYIGAKTVNIVKAFICLLYPVAFPISVVLDWVLGQEMVCLPPPRSSQKPRHPPPPAGNLVRAVRLSRRGPTRRERPLAMDLWAQLMRA